VFASLNAAGDSSKGGRCRPRGARSLPLRCHVRWHLRPAPRAPTSAASASGCPAFSAAAPAQPGWAFTTIYYHSSVEGGRDRAFPLGGTIVAGLQGRPDLALPAGVRRRPAGRVHLARLGRLSGLRQCEGLPGIRAREPARRLERVADALVLTRRSRDAGDNNETKSHKIAQAAPSSAAPTSPRSRRASACAEPTSATSDSSHR
jgi:hypothetical protein